MSNWKSVVGYEGRYEVSDEGQVASLGTERKHFMGGIRKYKPQMLKPVLSRHGYPTVNLTDSKGTRKHKGIHRLVAQAFIPNPDNKPCINHKDGNRANNDINNLEWCTYAENNLHAFRVNHRIHPRSMLGRKGSLNHRSKPVTLNGTTYVSGVEAAQALGVSVSTITNRRKLIQNDKENN